MLKKLHKLVIKSYIGPLIMTFFIAEFVLIMQFLWLYIGDLVGKGLEWYIIAELLMYSSAKLAQMALPLAILLASIMTFGNMGEHFELSAMKSAGISLQKIMKPLIIFSIAISIGSFFFANYVIPYTNLKMGSLFYDISNKRPEMNIKPGVFSNDIPNFSIKIKDKSTTSNMMYGFMIYDHRSHRGNVKVTLADSGLMEITADQKYMIITLFGGKSYEEMKDDKPFEKNRPENKAYFDKQVSVFELEGLDMKRTNENLFRDNHNMKRLSQLQKDKDSLSVVLKKRNNQYVNHLLISDYFKYELKYNKIRDSLQYINDSIHKLLPPDSLIVVADIDSIFKALDTRNRTRVMKTALENAKSTRKYISSTQNDLYSRQKRINKHDIAWHQKFTLAFACLIFFFIGAPLGAIIRKGGFGLPFLVSITFFILYYVVSLMGRKFVEEGVLLSWQGMWLSSLITLPLGVLFTYKATTDSVLFDIGAYVEFVKRPFKVFEIQYKDPMVAFHRDVELLRGKELLKELQNFTTQLNQNKNTLVKELSIKKLFKKHFNSDNSKLESFIELYNKLYAILSINYRENKFFTASLEKFPRIDANYYKLTKKQIIANYFLLTIGIFPIGILILLRSYIKHRVLIQKLKIIKDELKSFEEQLEDEREIKLLDKKIKNLRDIEEKRLAQSKEQIKPIKIESKQNDNQISNEVILKNIDELNALIYSNIDGLREQTRTLYPFLKLLLSKDINEIENLTIKLRELNRLINNKFSDNEHITNIIERWEWINFEQYEMSNAKILTNYILFGFFIPIAAIVFFIAHRKLQKLINKLEINVEITNDIAKLIKTNAYKQESSDIFKNVLNVWNKEIDEIQIEDINLLFNKLQQDLLQQIQFVEEKQTSIFEFLYLLLSTKLNDSTKQINNFCVRLSRLLEKKYHNVDSLYNEIRKCSDTVHIRFKQGKFKVLLSYLQLTIFPIGFIYFMFRYRNLKNYYQKLMQTNEIIKELRKLIIKN